MHEPVSNPARRRFLAVSLKATAGLLLLPRLGRGLMATQTGAVLDAPAGVLDVPTAGYPLLEIAGSHAEIGYRIGTAMKGPIATHLEHSRIYPACLEYLQGEGKKTVHRMLAHARDRFAPFVEELQGMAEGLGIPFLSLFAFNCRSEIELLKQPSGCSTIALHDGDRMILAHNEDGDDLNIGRMFLVQVTPPSGVMFVSFVYPGLLPGNGPGFNVYGMAQSTNYIQPREVADGAPRYFIGRALLEAKSLTEAIELVTMTPRAFSWHYNLFSLAEKKILSVETIAAPEPRHDILQVEGLYIHTNHLLHPVFAAENDGAAPVFDVPYGSSTTRYDVLTRTVAAQGPPADADGILQLLSLHEGRPYSPCRHPEGEVHGATLGTAVFAAPVKGMRLYHGNPCLGMQKTYVL